MNVHSIRLSVVLPVRDEESILVETHRRLSAAMRSVGEPYELIFVDDGSGDGSREILRRLCREDGSVRLLALSRSFGQQAAFSAGIDVAGGDAVILMDADLQDPPELIPLLIDAWRDGSDVVCARREARKGDTPAKRAAASLFYSLFARITGGRVPRDVGDFRLMDRKVCEALKGVRERDRFLRGLVAWLGFRQTEVPYTRREREGGATKYTVRKMAALAATAITSFSAAPLRIPLYVGTLFGSIGITCLVLLSAGVLPAGRDDFPWIFVSCLVLLVGGAVLAAIGVVGVYLGKVLDESKGRPPYIVEEAIGFPAR